MIDTNGTIQVERRIAVKPERAFDAWLDPGVACQWLFATPEGKVVRCEIDPRAGGTFVITDRRGGDDVEHVGTYLEIQRPRRLAFSFGVPKYSSELSNVVIEVSPEVDGCLVVLVNHDVPAEWRSQTEQGWNELLARLDEILTARPGA